MDERLTQAPEQAPGSLKPRGRRVDVITRLAVVRAHQAQPGLSVGELAATYGISESSVRRILAVQTADRKETVRAMLLSGAEDVIEHWFEAVAVAAAKGYHQPAKDLLMAAEAIEPKPAVAANVNVAPTLVLNMPFTIGAIVEPPSAASGGTTIEATRPAPPTLPTRPVK